MSFLGGIGRGRGPVPSAQKPDNSKQEKTTTVSSVIKSARWGRSQAGLNDSVAINVVLNKPAMNPKATVEFFFNAPGAQPHPFDNPITIAVTGLSANGHWQAKAPKVREWTKGHFTFRVKIDGQTVMSDALKLTDDPVAKVMRRISTDGFDG
jgi:hypothetical protein